MASQRQVRRMRRQGLTCGAVDRECDMQVERALVHRGPDGWVFRVLRLLCVVCLRQLLVANRETAVAPEPTGVEIYDEGNLWRGC